MNRCGVVANDNGRTGRSVRVVAADGVGKHGLAGRRVLAVRGRAA